MSRSKNLYLLIPKTAVQLIGIDPGTRTGVAVWNRAQMQFTKLVTLDIFDAMKLVIEYCSKDRSIILIEDPNLRTTYGDNSYQKLQGAGSIKRDYAQWIKELKKQGIEYIPLAPQDFQSIDNHQIFCKVINQHFSRTSEHSRDAAMMVYRR